MMKPGDLVYDRDLDMMGLVINEFSRIGKSTLFQVMFSANFLTLISGSDTNVEVISENQN